MNRQLLLDRLQKQLSRVDEVAQMEEDFSSVGRLNQVVRLMLLVQIQWIRGDLSYWLGPQDGTIEPRIDEFKELVLAMDGMGDARSVATPKSSLPADEWIDIPCGDWTVPGHSALEQTSAARVRRSAVADAFEGCHVISRRQLESYRSANGRAEKAEAELARISDEMGLPPGIGPAEGELRRLLSGATDDTPETIEAACEAYDVATNAACDPETGHRAGIRAARKVLPLPRVVDTGNLSELGAEALARELVREREAHDRSVADGRAEVERLTKALDGERAELGHVRAELRDTAAKLSTLRSAPTPCTHADLLGPVTEEEKGELKTEWQNDFRDGWNYTEACLAALNAVLEARRARAGEPTVTEAEKDAAVAAIDVPNAREVAAACLLAAAKVRAKGGAT